MKKLELEQLRKDINARIDAIINTVINQKEGFWCKSNKLPIYIHKSGIEDGKYATIINPMQAKLEEAKLKYPTLTAICTALFWAKADKLLLVKTKEKTYNVTKT